MSLVRCHQCNTKLSINILTPCPICGEPDPLHKGRKPDGSRFAIRATVVVVLMVILLFVAIPELVNLFTFKKGNQLF